MSKFTDAIAEKAEETYSIAKSKGWWDSQREDGTMIALMHSELSETLEALRHDNPKSDKIPDFTGAEEEIADVIIRAFDWCRHKGFRLGGAIEAKMEFNRGREFKHGGKAF